MEQTFHRYRILRRQVLIELKQLTADATMCPGLLARRLGTTLATIRPLLLEMEKSGEILVTQRGRPTSLESVRGPFRVRLPLPSSKHADGF